MFNLSEQEIQEMQANANYFIRQLIADRKLLQDEVDYLKGQIAILKGEVEDGSR